jgi:hypothetical protein
MSKQNFEEHQEEVFELSDRLFGRAEDLDLAEAESLLRASGVEPDEVVRSVQERMAARKEAYSIARRPVPALLEQALEELKPRTDLQGSEAAIFREARAAVRRVLDEVKRLGASADPGVTATFAAAYRKKSELSERDKQLLDSVVENLQGRAQGGRKQS